MKTTADIHLDDDAGRRGAIFAEQRIAPAPISHRRPVTHDFAALAFYTDGRARIEQRARWTLEAGDVLIVPPGEPHRLIDARSPAMWRVGFCVPCLAADSSTALLEPFDRVRNGASPVVRIAPDRRPFLESLFKELSAIGPAASIAPSVRISLLTLILHEVTRAMEWSGTAGTGRSLVAETLRFIDRHCLEPLTLSQIATAMSRTPSHITTMLTRATGRSAVAWIIAGRMAEARRRLLHSDENVDTIAERVGYADPTHFIRLFRRVHGATPSAWRAMQAAHIRPTPQLSPSRS